MAASASTIARAQAALQAGQRARVVRRARLAPARAEDAAQLRFAVEDALNTADFNDCGRLIVVRRLQLQGLPPRASTALVARAIEEAWRVAARLAVPASHSQAESAGAVYFASRFEARAAWLERVALGCDAAAWFWRAAMPELSPAPHAAPRAVQSSVEIVLEAMLQESVRAVVEVLSAWADDAVVALAGVVGAAMNERLLTAMVERRDGLLTVSPAGADAGAAHALVIRLAPEAKRELARRVERALRGGPLPLWVPAMWVAQAVGQPVPRQVVEGVLSALGDEVIAGGVERDIIPASVIPAKAGSHSQPASMDPGLRRDDGGQAAQPNGAPRQAVEQARLPNVEARGHASVLRMETPTRLARSRTASTRRSPCAYPWLSDAVPTNHGGLLIVLNVLAALRFDQWLDANPQGPSFVDALFGHLLRFVQCPASDPQWSWLSLPLSPGEALAPTLRLWTARLRRTLRRHVRLDLAELITRRAWISTTPTHIDLIFPLDEVDLRLRRHNLDADPGWVPWFGRIVAFHFVARDLLPEEPLDG